MLDLNRIGSGQKLLRQVFTKNGLKGAPASKQEQAKTLVTRKNTHSSKSRPPTPF